MRLEALFLLLTYIGPLLALLAGIVWWSERDKPMATRIRK